MQDMDDLEDQPLTLNNPSTEYGGFWIRLITFIIDYLVIGIPCLMLAFIVNFICNFDEVQMELFKDLIAYIMSLFWWIYYASFHSSKWQASIGKRAMGLKVVDKYGNRISFGRATGRYFSMLLSTILLFIGYMMIGWNSHKQGLHDLIAKTYVIRSGRM